MADQRVTKLADEECNDESKSDLPVELDKTLLQDIIGTVSQSEPVTESLDTKDNHVTAEKTNEVDNSEQTNLKKSRELKLLLALSKEANLDTNISHKRNSLEANKTKDKDLSRTSGASLDPDVKRVSKVAHESRDFRYPVTAESELELDISEHSKKGLGDNANKVSKRKREGLSEVSTGGATDEFGKKNKKPHSGDMATYKPNKDMFCWRCHREGVNIACETCPRSYHQKCLKQTISDTQHWPCPECVSILKAESTQTRSTAMKGMTLEHLCSLLKFAVKRMIQCQGSEPFLHPVSDIEFSDYKRYIVQPMDLTKIQRNIKENLYGSTQAFEADAKWLLHNSIIYNSYQSKLTTTAKNIIRICKQEMAEIENCSSCYLNANTKKDTWFVEVCPKPHLLVWAKLKGFPFWPAKAMCANSSGMVDVRFFGAHDRAWVHYKECYLFSEKDPNTFKQKRYDIEKCVDELNIYIENLKRVYGEFRYAPYKTVLDPDNDLKQLQIFLPKYKSTSHRKKSSNNDDSKKTSDEDKKEKKDTNNPELSDVKSNPMEKEKSDIESKTLNQTKNDIEPDQNVVEVKSDPRDINQNGSDLNINGVSPDKDTSRDLSTFNDDIMEGYGTDDDTNVEIDLEKRKHFIGKNAGRTSQKNEELSQDEDEEDDTQVPSNISVESPDVRDDDKRMEVVSIPLSVNIPVSTRRVSETNFNQKRPSNEDVQSPHKIPRRNSDLNVKSDSTVMPSMSEKINRVDISEDMEITLGNDDIGCISISENVSSNSSDSEVSRSGSEQGKRKPVQVDIENTEFTISPTNKLKISDKLIQRLSDRDKNVATESKVEEAKKNIVGKKSPTDILIEKFKNVVDHDIVDFSQPSTSSVEKNVSDSSKVDESKDKDSATPSNDDKNKMEPSKAINDVKNKIKNVIGQWKAIDDLKNKDQNNKEQSKEIDDLKNKDKNVKEQSTVIDDTKRKDKDIEQSKAFDIKIKNVMGQSKAIDDTKNKDKNIMEQRKVIDDAKNKDKNIMKPSKGIVDTKNKGENILRKDKTIDDMKDKHFSIQQQPASMDKAKKESGKTSTLNTEEDNAPLSPSRSDISENEFDKETTNKEVEPPDTSNKEKNKDTAENKTSSNLETSEETLKQQNALIQHCITEFSASSSSSKNDEKETSTDKNVAIPNASKVESTPQTEPCETVNPVVMNIIEEFEDSEDMDILDDISIDKNNIFNIIHSSLNEAKVTDAKEKSKLADKPEHTDDPMAANRKRKVSSEESPSSQAKLVKLVPIESIMNKPIDKEKETTTSPLLQRTLQGKKMIPNPSSSSSTPVSSVSRQSSLQEIVPEEIKSEPDTDDDFSESENLEAKRKYLSALNISEKISDADKKQANAIRTRSKTEEKREKFKKLDNLARVIDDVALNYSAQAQPSPARPKGVSNPQEGEIFVKSFAKMTPYKARARKSFPTPSYMKPNVQPKLNTIQVPKVNNSQMSVLRKECFPNIANKDIGKSNVTLSCNKVVLANPVTTTSQSQQTTVTGNSSVSHVIILPPTQALNYSSPVIHPVLTLVSSDVSTMATPTTQTTAQTLLKTTPVAPNIIASQNYIPQNGQRNENNTPGSSAVPQNVTNHPALVPATREPDQTQSSESSSNPTTNEGPHEDEFNVLNSLLPENVTRAVSDLLLRMPPRLKPRPPGPLSSVFDEGVPSSAGNVTAKINSVAHRLGDYFRGMLIETLEDLGKSSTPEAKITSLQMEIEALKHRHGVEMSEVRKNVCTILKDIQKSIVEDRERIIDETRASCEAETIKRVELAKSKQWCANCSKEAQFYCCWNTSYCDYPCQQKHWPQHVGKCTQNIEKSNNVATAASRPTGQQLILRPTVPPKPGMGRIVAKPTKVYMNRTGGAPKTFKTLTTSGNHLTVIETTPGNYELVGNGPIAVSGKILATSSGIFHPKFKSANIVSMASTSTSGNVEQRTIQRVSTASSESSSHTATPIASSSAASVLDDDTD